ncbi:MAG TPA: hypothetical protein VE619_02755 [Nitrososphaeraceae archaeon]|jgi:uncharacterized membrane protein (DUF2068 family)|nr:hypothetical protein [Nitrososphaeraceae archaeon]
MENYQKHRPLGVTIIAILTVIGGIAFVAIGTVLLVVGIGFVLIAISIAYFAMAYGLWNGKRWAWTITLILSGIGIILAIASIAVGNIGAVFHIILNAVIIYYLYRPNVKAFFGKSNL